MSESDIDAGRSEALRTQLLKAVNERVSTPVVLDKPRTITVKSFRISKGTIGKTDEMTFICQDTDERVTIVIHIPYEKDAIAKSIIIDHTENN